MNLKQLEYVLTLSNSGSFSKAAESLNISQPSLSQYIKKIEKELGTDLFIRANGEVRLTDAGRVYIDAGKKILSLEHQMQNKLVDIASFKSGTIKVGISPYRSFHLIPEVLKEFDKLYPNIELIITEKSGSDLIESAFHGAFDLCVIALPVDERAFNFEIIRREEILIAVNKKTALYEILNSKSEVLPNRKFPAVDINLVNGFDFAVLNSFTPMCYVINNILDEYDVKINEKIELSSNEALLTVVNSGVCASFIPSGLVDGRNADISFFSLKQDLDFRDIAVIWRKDQYLSEPILNLIQIFKALK